eukprot:45917-Rhodomonas_salina.1
MQAGTSTNRRDSRRCQRRRGWGGAGARENGRPQPYPRTSVPDSRLPSRPSPLRVSPSQSTHPSRPAMPQERGPALDVKQTEDVFWQLASAQTLPLSSSAPCTTQPSTCGVLPPAHRPGQSVRDRDRQTETRTGNRDRDRDRDRD